MAKACPNCNHKLGFLTYITRYNSDSLVQHTKAGHKREHECLKCRQRLWIYYNPFRFRNLLAQYLIAALLASWYLAVVAAKPAFQLDLKQTVLFTLVILGITFPSALSAAKYQSASFKEEHSPSNSSNKRS